ncbi:hypothetical protein NPIL_96381 [Nephila pilipes]|uniref:Uncharacterized protein n=1 Tax=Nephila pilipes TaxID=299642 RepID=A0A8X6TST0_NEPPI|nr:hypothetical protein NPIL_96381 [Nephila pilipes]
MSYSDDLDTIALGYHCLSSEIDLVTWLPPLIWIPAKLKNSDAPPTSAPPQTAFAVEGKTKGETPSIPVARTSPPT